MGNSESLGTQSTGDDTILKKADELGQKAAEAEAAKKYSEALELYNAAADYYTLASKYEAKCERDKDALKKKYIDILNRAEEIKKNNSCTMISAEDDSQSSASKQHEQDMIKIEMTKIEEADNPNIHWNDIAGLSEVKESLKEAVVLPAKYPHLLTVKAEKLGSKWQCRSVLLYGPPGSGKSLLCKATATESGSTLFSISSSDVYINYQGYSERLISKLFETARTKKPAVIFITNLESVFFKLEQKFLIHSEALSQQAIAIKSEFLKQMRKDNEGVAILGTTSLPWELDEDIMRCFDKQLFINLPDWGTRTELFKINLRYTKNSVDQLDYLTLGQVTEGYSGADIEAIVREAIMCSISKVQTATHFKKVTEPDPVDPTALISDLYTPCMPSEPDAIKMNWVDVPSNKLLEPQVTYKDCLCSVQKTRPTVTAAEFEDFMKFSCK